MACPRDRRPKVQRPHWIMFVITGYAILWMIYG